MISRVPDVNVSQSVDSTTAFGGDVGRDKGFIALMRGVLSGDDGGGGGCQLTTFEVIACVTRYARRIVPIVRYLLAVKTNCLNYLDIVIRIYRRSIYSFAKSSPK